MQGELDRNKSLQEIEQDDWGEPTREDSSLVRQCHHLRRKPLSEFTVQDLRIMIGQQISLPILVPLAVERLEANPLTEGNFYPGDLLAAVSQIDQTFWTDHDELLQRIRRVVARALKALPTLDEVESATVRKVLEEAPRVFMSM